MKPLAVALLCALIGGGAYAKDSEDCVAAAGMAAPEFAMPRVAAAIAKKRLDIAVIGIGNDKLDALQPGIDHVVDSVAARAADTKNGDSRLQLADVEIDAHGRPLGCKVGLTAKGRRAGLSLRRGVMAVGTASPR